MAKKVFNMQGGLHSAAAYTALENRAWGSSVASADSLAATPGAGMNLSVAPGDGLISVDAFNARRIQVTSTEAVPIPAADATYNRIDTLVAYINNSEAATTDVVDNINNILMFAVVAGTAAATPTAPSGAAIQLAIGAGNPYVALYDALIPQGATNASGVTLTDRRKVFTTIDASQLPNNVISTNKVQDGAITDTKKTTTHAFAVTKTGENTISNATFTKVPFNSENYDDGNNFANGEYTAPLAGKYMFTWHQATVGANGIITAIYVNGTSRFRGFWQEVPNAARSSNGSTIIKLNAGDVVSIYVYITTSGTPNVRATGDYSQFCGAYIGA